MVCIGGGENGRLLENGMYAPYETEIIDKEIVKLTKKKNPNFLFIDHAMPLIEVQNSYFKTMERIYWRKI